jgi:ubiquinone biosynthesis monooxygenase Coq7
MTTLSPTDRLIASLDNAMRTVFARHTAARPMPRAARPGSVAEEEPALGEPERRLSESLMRVNHVGEVCAQALYDAQAFGARDPQLRAQLQAASRDETDHLAWTEQRLRELGGRVSWLNPLWYAGAFGIGLLAGRVGDATSLGFVVETERQVEQHLASHLDRLPVADLESRAVVAQMRDDEARHAQEAESAGAAALPAPVRWAMRGLAGVMTRTAHYL